MNLYMCITIYPGLSVHYVYLAFRADFRCQVFFARKWTAQKISTLMAGRGGHLLFLRFFAKLFRCNQIVDVIVFTQVLNCHCTKMQTLQMLIFELSQC